MYFTDMDDIEGEGWERKHPSWKTLGVALLQASACLSAGFFIVVLLCG
jgi:hypothetical protein